VLGRALLPTAALVAAQQRARQREWVSGVSCGVVLLSYLLVSGQHGTTGCCAGVVEEAHMPIQGRCTPGTVRARQGTLQPAVHYGAVLELWDCRELYKLGRAVYERHAAARIAGQ
jgi:hypothetical protein